MSNNKRKILALIETMEIGGAEMDILRNFSQINQDEQYEIVLCIFGWRGALYQQLIEKGFRVISTRSKKWQERRSLWGKIKQRWEEIRWIHNTIKTEKPDIIHCFLPVAYLLACVDKLLTGLHKKPRPIYIMSRLSLNFYMGHHLVASWFEKMVCHRLMGFSAFIGNSRVIVKQLIQEGCAPEKVKLVYNGIDVKAWACDRQVHDFEQNPIKMVAVANLYTYKGYDDLIEALAQLTKKEPHLPSWLLKIAGEDRDGNLHRLKKKVYDLGLSETIHFLGGVDDISGLLAEAHLFVHPSHTEGLSNAVIEAMSSGLPIVATRVGGIPELIEDRKNGFLVEARAPEALAEAIKTALCRDRHLLYQMGQAGKAIASEKFDIRYSMSHFKKIYHELMSKPV